MIVIGEEIEHNELSSDRGTGKLVSMHKKTLEDAKEVFNPLFKRKQEAEDLRYSIGLIERYKYILRLPSSIHQAIEQKDVCYSWFSFFILILLK